MTLSTIFKPTITIHSRKYKLLDQIGEGGFAFVYKVMSINKDDNKEMYALKKIICQTEEQIDQARKEVQMMTCIKHPNILSLVDCSEKLSAKGGHTEMLLLMPLMAYSLQSIIDNGCGYPSCSFSDGLDVLNILRQCVEGVRAIHSHGVRHGDLKPANILLASSYHAVITDFGSASEIPFIVTSRSTALEVQERASELSTASYRAPELFNTPSSCTIAGEPDVWAIGCIMYCLFYSQTPFESPSEGLSTLAVMSAHYSIPESNVWSQDYLDVIDSCLKANPVDRTGIEDLSVTLKCILCPPLDLRATPSTVTIVSPIDSSIQAEAAEVITDDVFSTSGMSTTVDTLTSYSGDYVNVVGESDSNINNSNSDSSNFADFSDSNYVDVAAHLSAPDSSSSSCESSRELKLVTEEEEEEEEEGGVSMGLQSSFVSIGNSLKLSDFTISSPRSSPKKPPIHSSSSTDSSMDEFGDFCVPFADDLPTDNNANTDYIKTAAAAAAVVADDDDDDDEEEEVTVEGKEDEVAKGIGMQSSSESDRSDAAEVIDLWSIIITQCRNQSLIVKESAIFMMRFTGFPKKLVKKQYIWLALTASGLVVRKDRDLSSKVLHVLSLSQGVYMTQSDTMSIGLNGLSIQGSSPLPLDAVLQDPHSKQSTSSSTTNKTSDPWVTVHYSVDAVNRDPSTRSRREPFRARFEVCRFEIGFDSKDSMNDWMDAIDMQREQYAL